MPVRAQRKKNRVTARNIHAYFLEAAEAKTAAEKRHRDAYRRTDPSYIPEKVGHPKVKSPYVFGVINTKWSWLMRSIYANGMWVRAQARAPEYVDASPVMTRALNMQFTNRPLGNEMTMEMAFGEAFTYGDNWTLARHYPEDNSGHWGVQFINVHINDVYPDPFFGRYIILRRFITIAELGRMADDLSEQVLEPDETGEMVPAFDEFGKPRLRDGGVAKRAFLAVEKAAKDGHHTSRFGWSFTQHQNTFAIDFDKIQGDDEQSVTSRDDDIANLMVSVLEYHETDNDGIVAKIIPDNPMSDVRDDLFLQEAELHPYGMCQVRRFAPWPVGREPFGRSVSDIVGGLADLRDFSLRASARRVQRWADPAVLHRKRAKIQPMYLRSQSNVAIPVEDINRDIKVMDPPAGGDMHQNLMFITQNTMDEGLGEGAQRRGQSGADTATEAAIIQQASSASDFLVARRAFMFIAELGDLALRIMRVHITEEKAIPFMGRRAVTLMRLMPDALKHNYHIEVGGSLLGGNSAIRTTNLLQIFTQTAATGEWDGRAVIKRALEENGFVADEFLLRKDIGPPVPPRLEHKMVFDLNQEIAVHPEDAHDQHLGEHLPELLQRQGDPLTDPESLRQFLRHIQEHDALRQLALSQQQQQGQGQGNGQPQGFRPDQAGQQGQPAAFTPATQNIDDVRNAPNTGFAPQPGVAPNRTGVPLGGGF